MLPATPDLGDLGNVDLVTDAPAIGQTIVWDGFAWIPGDVGAGGGATELNDLTDVSATLPIADGDVLTWDNLAGEWYPETPSGSGVGFESVITATAAYTFVAADLNRLIRASWNLDTTYTIPDGLGQVGNTINLININNGVITIAMAGGATDTLSSSNNKCTTDHGITIVKDTATSWRVIGGSP
jgi:hypothetical protein